MVPPTPGIAHKHVRSLTLSRRRSCFFTYWPHHVAEAAVASSSAALAPVLAPDLETNWQLIDVRDLATFIVLCCERGDTGTFHAVNDYTVGEVLDACVARVAEEVVVTHVSSEFLGLP